MKLWIVERRSPLQRGRHAVDIERWAVMAETAEEAIDVERAPLLESEELRIEFASGAWSAEIVKGSQSLSLRPTRATPTAEEREDLAARVARSKARAAAKKA